MGNIVSRMSDESAPLINENDLILEIKGSDDLMNSTQIAQLTWLLERKVSQEKIVKFFEETTP